MCTDINMNSDLSRTKEAVDPILANSDLGYYATRFLQIVCVHIYMWCGMAWCGCGVVVLWYPAVIISRVEYIDNYINICFFF